MGANWDFPKSEIKSELTHEFKRSILDYSDSLNTLSIGDDISVGTYPDSNLIKLDEFTIYNRSQNFKSIYRSSYDANKNICCRRQVNQYYTDLSENNYSENLTLINNVLKTCPEAQLNLMDCSDIFLQTCSNLDDPWCLKTFIKYLRTPTTRDHIINLKKFIDRMLVLVEQDLLSNQVKGFIIEIRKSFLEKKVADQTESVSGSSYLEPIQTDYYNILKKANQELDRIIFNYSKKFPDLFQCSFPSEGKNTLERICGSSVCNLTDPSLLLYEDFYRRYNCSLYKCEVDIKQIKNSNNIGDINFYCNTDEPEKNTYKLGVKKLINSTNILQLPDLNRIIFFVALFFIILVIGILYKENKKSDSKEFKKLNKNILNLN